MLGVKSCGVKPWVAVCVVTSKLDSNWLGVTELFDCHKDFKVNTT